MLGKKSNKETANSNPESPMVADISEESNDSAMIENVGQVENDEGTRNSESLLEDSTNIQHDKPEEPPKKKTGYLLWFDENRADLEKEHPDASTGDLTKIGMQQFRKLPKEEKQKYLKPSVDNEKKRKRSEIEDDEAAKNVKDSEKKSKIGSKLAAFIRTSSD
ncbi:Nucleolar transcription factor 1-A [Orchesella cincta]|uniref:Nucleolar transcription factor 1-A n=1 Tax=Orchesella cincta TaxID=48709 RepID=A0A1D2M9P0_ORCCI|nr:Nucleolar transcription factor 1-A [Orchesella cincta]